MKEKARSKFMSVVVMIVLLTMIVSGCSAKEASYTTTSDTSTVSYGEASEPSMPEKASMENSVSEALDMDVQADGMMADAGGTVQSDTTDVSPATEPQATTTPTNTDLKTISDNRMYIRTFNFQIETLEFDKTVADLDNLVNQYFGFFQSTEVTGRSIGYNNTISRQGIYTIRIPKEKAGDFLKGLVGIGNVLNNSSYVEDVTSQYVDISARIKTLKVQEDRLLAILEKANELQYMLELERELSSVRYEIESYTTSLRELESRVNYTTIYVTLNEVFEVTEVVTQPKTFIDKMVDGFKQSFNGVVSYLENVALFLITNIPTFVLLLVNLLIIYLVIRLLMRTKVIRNLFMLDSKMSKPKYDVPDLTKIQHNDEHTEKSKE